MPTICECQLAIIYLFIFKIRGFSLKVLFIIFTIGLNSQETPYKCVIDQCDDSVCTVETPEGWVDIPKRPDYGEGTRVVCPLWLIDPT